MKRRSFAIAASLLAFLLLQTAANVAPAEEARRATLTIRASEPGPQISYIMVRF